MQQKFLQQANADLPVYKGLRPLNNPEGFTCSMKKWQKPLFLTLRYDIMK